MAEQNWNEDYDYVLSQLSIPQLIDAEQEQRKFPRFKTQPVKVYGPSAQKYEVSDISAGGIAFGSKQRYDVGLKITINFEDLQLVEVEVVSCTMYESDSDFMEFLYRIGCEFVPPMDGKQIVVMMYQMHNLELTVV